MKRLNAILSASGLMILALSLPSWAQTRTLPTQTVTLSGTVETIDHAKRVVNIKTPDGKFETIDVPPAAKRFDELKVGDKVSITYNNTVSARLKPPGEPPVNTATGTTTAGQGERPGGTASLERTMTATITGIDRAHRPSPSPARTDGNTTDVSLIRLCSRRSRLATRLTSPGTQTSPLRCNNDPHGIADFPVPTNSGP